MGLGILGRCFCCRSVLLLVGALQLGGCGDGMNSLVEETPPEGELTGTPCEADSECNDGVFCNGEESCDGDFCRTGVAVDCDDQLDCTVDTCSHGSNSCQFTPPDEDGDNHADAACLDSTGEALGDDCDDQDPERFPGNQEICGEADPSHDEDCDAKSFGTLDADLDSETSAVCCNEDEEGVLRCGSDCDDDDYRRSGSYPEICDDLDNDCDEKVDNQPKEVPWYPDLDGDHFGDAEGESILSCAPVEDYALRATDCDDSTAAVNHAARELCDGVDNDCDGEIDEEGVCACAPEGHVRPCACGLGQSGVQNCSGGTWNSCDCTECITGTTDCVGELLPRTCHEGRWTTLPACSGLSPICLEGECRCADGTDDCQDVLDVFRPTVLSTSPLSGEVVSPELIIALEMSEEVSLSSALSALALQDSLGTGVTGTVGVSGTTVSFVPDAALSPGVVYEFMIKNTLEDLSGNALATTQKFSFETEAGTALVRVSSDPQIRYLAPTLAMSSAGTTLLLAQRTTGAELSSLIWEDDAWRRVGQALNFQPWPRVAVDDAGLAMSLFPFGTATQRQFLTAGVQTFRDTLADPAQSGLYGVESTGAGEFALFFEHEGNLKIQTKSASGTLSSFQEVPNSATPITSWAFASSRAGHGALVHTNDSGGFVFRSDEKFTSWISGSGGGPPANARQVSAAVSDDGIVTVAWVESVAISAEIYDQIQLQDLGLDGSWLGSATGVASTFKPRHEGNPKLAYDSAGNLFLAFTFDNSLVVNRRSGAGVWGAELVALAPGTTHQINHFELNTAVGQQASLIWTQTVLHTDLWGLRFAPVSGWTTSQLIENISHEISWFSSAMQPDGTTLVVFDSTDASDQPDLLSLEF